MHKDLLEYAVMGLRHRQLRSWLTVIGIVIGICAIILLVSIAQGLDAYIKDQLSIFGKDNIVIVPGSMKQMQSGGRTVGAISGRITDEDQKAVARISGVLVTGSTLEDRVSMKYRDQEVTIYCAAADPEIMTEIYSYEVGEGRQIRSGDRGVAVIGNGVANELFDTKIPIGRRLLINNRSFTVVGIMKKSTGLMAAAENVIYIPKEDGRKVMPRFEDNKDLTELHVKVKEGYDAKDVADDINSLLLRMHKVTEDRKDFTIMTADYIAEQINAIMGALTLFLAGVAAISLAVGSIGVANTMFMSVLERTREIGTMKAIGADENTIMEIFIIESALIGLIGGLIGIAISVTVSFVLASFGMPSKVTLELVLFALFFSLAVGIFSGFFPARRAAELEVVEALRYE